MPYRVSSMLHGASLAPAPPAIHATARARDGRRHLVRMAKAIAASVGLALALGAGVEIATWPALGPDVANIEEPPRSDLVLTSMRTSCTREEIVFDDEPSDSRADLYDVNARLRPEDPAPFGAEPNDDESPRRRSAPSDPDDAVIHGTITLVTDRTAISARRRPRQRR